MYAKRVNAGVTVVLCLCAGDSVRAEVRAELCA